MIIDNKGKVFGKINIIDIIIALIVVILLGGIGYKFSKSSDGLMSKSDKYLIEFYGDEVPEFAANAIKVGDEVGDYEKGAVFGRVKSVSVGKSNSVGQASSGQLVEASKPGFASVRVVVEGEGILKATGGVSLNNIDYFIGRSIVTRAGNAVIYSRIYDIKKKG